MVFAQYLCLTCCENPGQPNELRLAQPLEAVSVFWYHTAQFPLLKACDPGHLISPIIVFFHSRAGRTLLTYLSRAKSEHLAEVVAERICGDSKDDVDAQCFPVTAQQDWPPTPLHSATHQQSSLTQLQPPACTAWPVGPDEVTEAPVLRASSGPSPRNLPSPGWLSPCRRELLVPAAAPRPWRSRETSPPRLSVRLWCLAPAR